MNKKTLLALTLLAVSAPGFAGKRSLPPPAIIETRTASDAVPATATPQPAPAPAIQPAAPALAPADAPIAIEAVMPTTLPAATPAPGTGPASDDIWQKIILGTWQAVDSPDATQINGETTFTPDGKAVGYTTATYIYLGGATKEVRIGLTFDWKIVDGVLILDHYVSDPADFFPKTHSRRFEIKSLNDTGAVLRDLVDDQEIYRRRKPG